MSRGRSWRVVLVALLALGLVGIAGPATSGAVFTDGENATGSAEAAANFNNPGPTADAGGPYDVFEGGSQQLNGSDSTGKIQTYNWTIVSSNGSLSGADTATPNYQAPSDVDGDETATVELTVTDNQGATDTDTATITIKDTDESGDTTPPEITDFDASRSGNQVTVTFNSSEPLSEITVEVRKNKNQKTNMTESQISTSNTSPKYTYTGTVTVNSGGSYTATLTKAKDEAGNDCGCSPSAAT